ncbi:hypothetical protein COB72_08560 [bacterium]|nr:MAG: hypothetical protein COB72_08560 [bacterium]
MDDHDSYINETTRSSAMISNILQTPQRSRWARIRRGLLISIGCGCLMLGFVLSVTIIRSQTLQTMGTAELFAVVGFIVLPGFTFASIRFNRSTPKPVQATGCQQPLAQTRIAHHAHNRSLRSVHHPRAEDHTEKHREEQCDAA